MHSVVYLSVEQYNFACRGPRTVLGYIGKRGCGVEGYWCLRKSLGYNEVLALEVPNVVDCVERSRRAELLASVSAPRAVAAALSFQACLRVYICTCCMCVRMCV